MRLLMLAALAAVALADVSHLGSYQYNTPASSYGVPQNSVTERQFYAQPTSPSPGLNLPAFEHQDFNALNPLPGLAVSTTPAPFVDSGLVSSTPAPFFGGGLNLNSGFGSGFGYTTPAPSLDLGTNFVSSTPSPSIDVTSGSQEKLNIEPQINFNLNSGFNSFSTPAPTVFSSTVAPTLAPSFGLGLGSAYSFPGFGGSLGFSTTPAPIALGSGGLTSINAGLFNNDAALNSVSIHGVTSGGSIGDAFGVSPTGTVAAGTLPQPQEVSKHLYFFAAPEDPEPRQTRVNVAPVPPPRKNVRVIFIKAPAPAPPAPIRIAAPPQDEQKTVVYVLVKKPEETQNIEIEPAPPAPPAKPEVFFIKYRNQQEAEQAIAQVQNGGDAGSTPSVPAEAINGGGLLTSINRQASVNSPPIVNYISTTTTPAPLLNYNIGSGILGPIGTSSPLLNLNIGGGISGISGPGANNAFLINAGFDENDISQNLIGGGQLSSIYSTASPLISTTEGSLLGSSTVAPHVTYGTPYFKKK